jgi:TM2 domain-containing membrane protein YozV
VPNPLLAGLLGFIPGVGAMYNGQFAKGLAHIAVFAVFTSLADHVNGMFGLFVAGWVFYMAFEAYQTAVARRNGSPLPDPFGLNNIGERFGFHASAHPDLNHAWSQTGGKMPGAAPFVAGQPGAVPPVYEATYQVDPTGNAYPAGSPPPPGYVPPVPPPPPSASWGSANYGSGYGSQNYGAQGYGAAPVPPPPPLYGMPPVPPPPPGYSMPPAAPARGGLPVGALWLIGLGFFALLGSLHPFAFLEGEATGGLFLIGLAVFMFLRRSNSNVYPQGSPAARWSLIRASKGAGFIFIIGVLTLLQGLHIARWHESWPFLLIFLGVVMVMERVAVNNMNVAGTYPGYPASPVPPPPDSAAASSEEEGSTSIVPKYTRPANDLSINPSADNSGEGR